MSPEAIGERLSELLHQDSNQQVALGAARVALDAYHKVAELSPKPSKESPNLDLQDCLAFTLRLATKKREERSFSEQEEGLIREFSQLLPLEVETG